MDKYKSELERKKTGNWSQIQICFRFKKIKQNKSVYLMILSDILLKLGEVIESYL